LLLAAVFSPREFEFLWKQRLWRCFQRNFLQFQVVVPFQKLILDSEKDSGTYDSREKNLEHTVKNLPPSLVKNKESI
jgi:hypothetical protein